MPFLRAAVLAAALVQAAPLAAQDTPASAHISDPSTAPEMTKVEAPASIVLITGTASVISRYPDGIVTDQEFCINAGESAVLSSNRTTFELVGNACYSLVSAERQAFFIEQRLVDIQALSDAEAAHDAARKSGTKAEIKRTSHELKIAKLKVRMERRRPILISGVLSPMARPIIFRLASGSPSVLARFPRGMIVQHSTALCLTGGEQLTISSSIGQSATYTGPGCLKRQGKPTRENIGAFVFG